MKLIIPKTLRVGFQNRDDTYTGRLAYVTYIDAKGKHRSQISWENWRDKRIPSEDFKNEPTSGFVLNKKVGGYASDWNHRQAYARIFDPRGFEFEITIENLLYIMAHSSIIKGKGIEEACVYAWDGSTHIVMPVTSPDFQASKDFTSLQTQKVTRKDMVEGCLYRNKYDHTVMYLGRFKDVHHYDRWAPSGNPTVKTQHVFRYVERPNDSHDDYWFQTGFTKLAERISHEPEANYVNWLDEFKQSSYLSGPVSIELRPYINQYEYLARQCWYAYQHIDDSTHLIYPCSWLKRRMIYGGCIVFKGIQHRIVNTKSPEWFDKIDPHIQPRWETVEGMFSRYPGSVKLPVRVNQYGNYVQEHDIQEAAP